jgi:type II secretory pathway component PulM
MKWMQKVETLYDQLTVREQRILVSLVLVVLAFGFLMFVFFIKEGFDERRERISALRDAVTLMQKNRSLVQEGKDAQASLEMKAVNKPPMLQGHLDTLAKQVELSPNITPQKPKDLGDNQEILVESVELRLHDAPIKNLFQFLDQVERGNYLMMVTEIKINTRRGQPDRMDPVLFVSSYYKRSAEELKALHEKASESDKDKGEKKDPDKTDKDVL